MPTTRATSTVSDRKCYFHQSFFAFRPRAKCFWDLTLAGSVEDCSACPSVSTFSFPGPLPDWIQAELSLPRARYRAILTTFPPISDFPQSLVEALVRATALFLAPADKPHQSSPGAPCSAPELPPQLSSFLKTQPLCSGLFLPDLPIFPPHFTPEQ